MPKPDSQIPMVAGEYVDTLTGDRVTKLVHQIATQFHISGTVTGRMSSKEPNLSNKPSYDWLSIEGPLVRHWWEQQGPENLHDAGGVA